MQESHYRLRVQLSAQGTRMVRSHCSDFAWYPDGSRGRNRRGAMANYNNQKYQKPKRMWFKIIIPCGRRYDKMWLLGSIENVCGFHFRAFKFHYERNVATFLVDSFSIARSLVQASNKIQDPNYHKIIIRAAPFDTPELQMNMNIISPFDTVNSLDRTAEHIQSCLRKRYNQSLESLDLSDLTSDPVLLSANIFFSVSNSSATEIVLQIISECYPQLRSLNLRRNKLSKLTGFVHLFHLTPQLQSLNLSYNQLCNAQELDLIHNLELRELWLEGNPLLVAVESCSAYYRMVTHHFPTIEKLDGQLFKKNSLFELEKPKPLPPIKESFFGCDELRSFLAKFLHQYFTLYDSEDRQALLPLYHENACCSFSLPNVFYPRNRFNQIKGYRTENRNLLTVRRPEMRSQLLKYNRLQVVGFLCNLPRTQHDLPSMTLDVSSQTAFMIFFIVEGKFREVKLSHCSTQFIPFRRTFIIVPAAENSSLIVNDQMVILNSYVEPQEASSRLPATSSLAVCKAPPPAASNIASWFSQYTGMKLNWAVKCLQDTNWDVQKAKETFHRLQGTIPQEAFKVEEGAGDMSG